ncbi:alpha/beta fold hydrolase [Sphaerisporangium corydalis]|uniref:Alpha/beta fold hydrolase n=1 Tax=Sphaerisporangium corydalis TaxID=1441875 RepID=A0ABV9EKF7_9ACTN|nr:alpha/beta hydrolase [Sphaerisporangium corydalis]
MNLFTRTHGDGPAVLWIHGYTMDSSVWKELWTLLPGWRHVGVDLPGHGRSGPLPPGTSLSAVGAELAALARAESARLVVAESIGSMIALQMAIGDPEAIRGLIIGSPTIAGAPAEPGTGDRYRALAALARFGASGEQLADLWMSSPPDIFRGTERHPALRARLRSVVARHAWKELSDGAMYGLSRHVHTAQDLGGIRAATLVVVGDEDMPTFRTSAELLRATVPRCRTLTVPAAGHLCLIERPETVASAVGDHLLLAEREGLRADSPVL